MSPARNLGPALSISPFLPEAGAKHLLAAGIPSMCCLCRNVPRGFWLLQHKKSLEVTRKKPSKLKINNLAPSEDGVPRQSSTLTAGGDTRGMQRPTAEISCPGQKPLEPGASKTLGR